MNHKSSREMTAAARIKQVLNDEKTTYTKPRIHVTPALGGSGQFKRALAGGCHEEKRAKRAGGNVDAKLFP